MEYIRCHEVEQLLEKYPDMKIMTESIRMQMRNVLDSTDICDDIEALALKHSTAKEIEEMGGFSPGFISDKTAKTALRYHEVFNTEKKEALQELRGELLTLETIINKLDIGVSILTALQKDIIIARCCEGMKWSELVDRINKSEYVLSVTSAKVRHKQGLDRLCVVSRISINEYQEVLKLFNSEQNGGVEFAR